MTLAKRKKSHATVIFTVYLYQRCHRAKQKGVIYMRDPQKNTKKDHKFDYLDEIPRFIRQHLAEIGLTYDIDNHTDDTVITARQRKRKVTKKIR